MGREGGAKSGWMEKTERPGGRKYCVGAKERLLEKIKKGGASWKRLRCRGRGLKKETARSDKIRRRDERRADVAKEQMKRRTRGDEMR